MGGGRGETRPIKENQFFPAVTPPLLFRMDQSERRAIVDTDHSGARNQGGGRGLESFLFFFSEHFYSKVVFEFGKV